MTSHYLLLMVAAFGLAIGPRAYAGDRPAPLVEELAKIEGGTGLDPAQHAARLAQVYTALGAVDAAQEHAQEALALAPNSAFAAHVMVQALALAGDEAGALKLALARWQDPEIAFESGIRGGLRHMILGLYFRRDAFREAEAFLEAEFPDMRAHFAGLGEGRELPRRYPPHAVQSLVHIYSATGRAALAEAPARYARDAQLALLPGEGEEWSAAQHWIAAAADVGFADESNVLAELRASFFGGFQTDWRFNFAYHPVFQPLWDSDAFASLIAEFEADVARQRAMIAE